MSETVLPDFSQVYEAYHGKVRGWAAKLIGEGEADDVAQEVFVKISRFLETLDDPSKLSSWVYAITLNTVRDAARKRSARPVPITESRKLAGAANDEPSALACIADSNSHSPEERAMRDEMVACYLDYVNELPRKHFEVYVLSELEGLSNDEVARRLSLSLGAVKIRLHRARAQLNEKLRCNCRPYYNERGELMGEPKKT